MNFNMTIDGSRLEQASQTDATLVGPGYALGLEGILLSLGRQDDLTILPDENVLPYETESSVSPSIVVAVEQADADYLFEIQGVDMEGGGAIKLAFDAKEGDLIVNAEELKTDGTFSLWMTRIDDESEETFYNDAIVLKSGGIIYVNFAEWTGNGGEVLVGIDIDGGENPDEVFSSADEN